MEKIKIILKSLYKRKISSLLIIIQLTITIILLMNSFIMINSTNYLQNQIESKNIDLKRTIHLSIYNASFSEHFALNYNELEKHIRNNDHIKSFGAFDLSNTTFEELESDSKFRKLRKELTKGTFKEFHTSAIETLTVDNGIYNLMNLKITQGRGLTHEDFCKNKDDLIPLLVGSKYKDIIKLNQIITNKGNDNIKYKVVGFFDKDSNWFNDQDYIYNILTNLDDKLVLPYTGNQIKSPLYIMCKANSIFFVIDDIKNFKNIENYINIKANSLKMRVESKSIYDELQGFKNDSRETININLFLAVFLIFLSCSGIITVFLSSIINRKREFGIRITCGASISNVKEIILGEIISLTFISFVNSIIIVFISKIHDYNFNKINDIGINPMENITPRIIIYTILLLAVIVLITSFVPLKRIEKLQPKELIGGTD